MQVGLRERWTRKQNSVRLFLAFSLLCHCTLNRCFLLSFCRLAFSIFLQGINFPFTHHLALLKYLSILQVWKRVSLCTKLRVWLHCCQLEGGNEDLLGHGMGTHSTLKVLHTQCCVDSHKMHRNVCSWILPLEQATLLLLSNVQLPVCPGLSYSSFHDLGMHTRHLHYVS